MSRKPPIIIALMIVFGVITTAGIFLVGYWWGTRFDKTTQADKAKSASTQSPAPEPPYQTFTIPALTKYPFKPSHLAIDHIQEQTPTATVYHFAYTTYNKRMTGQLHLPTTPMPPDGYPVIIMARGFVPVETYSTGTGTKPAATVFAQNGYATIAPDFFGYGNSDPEPEDVWEARFIKPINIIELALSVKSYPELTLTLDPATAPVTPTTTDTALTVKDKTIRFNQNKLGFWGHSNGGQILLTALELSGEPVPTSLWAPVTAPFPYSVLYFSDEQSDEGKEARKWVALFEEQHDVFEFSLTKHLGLITAPLQIQHGTADAAAPIAWSDEFKQKVTAENKRRSENNQPPLQLEYYRYDGVDHNMRPRWSAAVRRDLQFFNQALENTTSKN